MKRTAAGRSAGFTLVETLVALSLLSIVAGMAYSFFLFANKQVIMREKKAVAFDGSVMLLEAIAKNIGSSAGTISADENTWVFVTERGDTAAYRFNSGTLRFKDLELTIGGKPLAQVSFACFGSDSTLDRDDDGEIDQRELDTDGDGLVDESETAKISRIRVALVLEQDSMDTLAIVESVKNNRIGYVP